MEENSKQLLLKDLCARLPYGVQCCAKNNHKISGSLVGIIGENVHIFSSGHGVFSINVIKPYLFPLSSMTEEQLFEVQEILGKNEIEIGDGFLSIIDSGRNTITYLEILAVLEWFYKNHFDVNNLIPMGLAIDATGLNIY